ncbi:hypothetical protein [Kitasatospora sp. NPDC056531]|uniref:hypothetical protein n=1 Tax=Kitasatospora sp. NPDC056531 TaxID=3345856 RepID=UPI0036831C21
MNPGTGQRPGRARRALGPGTDRVLADTVRAPRTPPPWSPTAVDTALRTLLDAFQQTTEPWRDAFEGLDEDVLAEAAQDRPLPEWAADAGRTEDVRWRRARQALIEAVARHHRGHLPAGPPDDRPW